MITIKLTVEQSMYLMNLLHRGFDTVTEQLKEYEKNPRLNVTSETKKYLIQCRKFGKKLKSETQKIVLKSDVGTINL